MTARRRFIGGIIAASAALTLGVLAAWPIYETPWLWAVAGSALVFGVAAAWARERWRLGVPVFLALLIAVFALTVLPIAVPDLVFAAPLRGLVEGLAAVALGWKQLLTLELPVGTYQTVLVPAYVVFFVSTVLIVVLAQRGRAIPVFAAIPMLAPVAFGTLFGASAVSSPLRIGSFTIVAPRETGLWIAAAALAAIWVAWTAGAERRAALRLGREGDEKRRRGSITRGVLAAASLVVALAAGVALAPVLDAGARDVPRDHAYPEVVVRDTPSPLAAYRNAKRDSELDSPWFTISSDGALPARLQLAVLDAYDGVDFHVSEDQAGLFTRFPSGQPAEVPAEIDVQVREGYSDIWVPIAGLASVPSFTGARAATLSEAFYLNRDTGAAIAVPRGADAQPGFIAGDGYVAQVETATQGGSGQALEAPRSSAPRIDVEQVPELATWLEAQETTDFTILLERLRGRGYLSHSLTDGEGERLWLERLGQEYGTTFESSQGGHSLARIEALFEQLNSQQQAAGEDATEQQLIAGIGDDEQFAVAAALVARALGYDSRVVLGVRLQGEAVPGVPLCEAECTGSHLAAWVEVQDADGVWTAFDVTPQVEEAPQRIEEGERLPEFSTTPEEHDAREVDPPLGLGEEGGSDNDEGEAETAEWLWPILRVILLSLAALLLLLLPILFLPIAKRIRSNRRERFEPAELRALGAWEEITDRARDSAIVLPAGASRSEVAEAIGTAPARWAAEQVDRAVFSAQSITDTDADNLWLAVRADTEERRNGQSRWERLRAAYSLRSYRPRARRQRGGRDATVPGDDDRREAS